MRRRLFDTEREVATIGNLSLTTHRVILFEDGKAWACTAILLRHVCSTTVRQRFGRTVLKVRSASARLVVRLGKHDAARARSMADRIDAAASIGLDTRGLSATDRW